jgi:hypothetical protein
MTKATKKHIRTARVAQVKTPKPDVEGARVLASSLWGDIVEIEQFNAAVGIMAEYATEHNKDLSSALWGIHNGLGDRVKLAYEKQDLLIDLITGKRRATTPEASQ